MRRFVEAQATSIPLQKAHRVPRASTSRPKRPIRWEVRHTAGSLVRAAPPTLVRARTLGRASTSVKAAPLGNPHTQGRAQAPSQLPPLDGASPRARCRDSTFHHIRTSRSSADCAVPWHFASLLSPVTCRHFSTDRKRKLRLGFRWVDVQLHITPLSD
mmetsp:Transcript_65268/g.120189  ORF Transcript_65268/g.120189 Transcript_65268/m.120189 type:complete len:158 (-) Transcript_65268:15-488(-)